MNVFHAWIVGILCLLLSVVMPSKVQAHPHEFVTLKIKANFNASGKISGFRYVWEFDEFFSAYAVEGQDKNENGKAEPDELNALLNEILGNIKPIDYFTRFEQNSIVPELEVAKPISASLEKRQLVLTFDIPFKAPIDVKEKALTYSIYDNEFYIAMQHADADAAVTLVDAPKGCEWKLQAPNPDEDVIAYAGSLGKTETGTPDLGASFAEWVTISCK